MTLEVKTYLGSVFLTADKEEKRFFPLKVEEVSNLEFHPIKEEFDTIEYCDSVKRYLVEESFIIDGGNVGKLKIRSLVKA